MNATTDDNPRTRDDAEFDRRVAALLEPAHEHEQFERLWARIAAERTTPPRRRTARRPISSFTALAASLLIGVGVAWYHHASAPSYTTLADPPHHACRPEPMQAEAARLPPSGAHLLPRVEPSGAPPHDRSNRLCTPEAMPSQFDRADHRSPTSS